MSQAYSPKILGFLCNWCCYTAADSAGVGRYQYPPNLRVIRMMCTGRLDPSFPLEGLATGADGIFVGGCHPGECHYIDGNYHALVSASLVHKMLDKLGIERERFLIEWASAAEGPNFVKSSPPLPKRSVRSAPWARQKARTARNYGFSLPPLPNRPGAARSEPA